MGEIALIVGILSAILTFIDFFLLKLQRNSRIIHAVYIIIVCLSISLATYFSSQFSRLNEVSKTATALVEKREMDFTHRGFILASLAFLEKNRDLFPESYALAKSMCAQNDFENIEKSSGIVELSFAMSGLLEGISTIENGKK